MPSIERSIGLGRRSSVAKRLGEAPSPPPAPDYEAAYKTEVNRRRAWMADEGPSEPQLRFSAAELPHPVPTKLKLGWQADAEIHGWFGGCAAQLEYIEAQSQKISALQKDLETARRASHAAIAARLREKAQAKVLNARAATVPATTPRPAGPAPAPAISNPQTQPPVQSQPRPATPKAFGSCLDTTVSTP